MSNLQQDIIHLQDNNFNIFLANLIYIFHIIIILFTLFAPLSNIPSILILHITFCITLMIHWIFNSNKCVLTLMESYLRNTNVTDTFSHAFISPIYEINSSEWNNIVWIITILAISISIYKLIYNPIFISVMSNIYSIKSFNDFILVINPLFLSQ